MPSADQTDILWELETLEAEEILSHMHPAEAADVRRLIEYDPDTAGGLMVTEFLSFSEDLTIKQIVSDLKKRKEEYQRLHIKYIYINEPNGRFAGVLQIQDLLLADPDTLLSEILLPDVMTVRHDFDLEHLVEFFHTHDFYGVPVVDANNFMLGVVLRKDVLEALADQTSAEHLESQGIVGGEELRTMPLLDRAKNRLSWLSINILLNIVAASVIAFHTDTLSSVIALAVFLPIISDMSGCSGNQAVAVSMRELSIGAVKASESLRVLFQELGVGLINGLALGSLIGLAAWIWKGSAMLGLVVGGALALNTLVAVSLGGTVPLILKNRGIDPALASGPILTTVTDMIGFFLVLTFASMAMSHIGGL
jgi:magnesium transporter